jgi:penicillin-binding protein 2
MRRALEKSCNVFFFQTALQCGNEAVSHMAVAMGLGQKTGIELDYETAGLVPDGGWKRRVYNDAWRNGDTCNLAIGQGALSVTPLQMAMVTATLANKGTLYRPRLVKGTRRPGDEQFVMRAPFVANQLNWTPANIDIVRLGMRDVVMSETGTGRYAAPGGVEFAGKTGTAEFGPKDARLRHAWMITFAPYHEPRYAVAMLVDEGVSGGETVAPRMRQLLGNLFAVDRGEGQGQG